MIDHQLSATRYPSEIGLDVDSPIRHAVDFIGRSKSVLEVGPATGLLTRHLVSHGCTVTAIEIDSDAAAVVASTGAEVHVGDVESLDLSSVLGSRQFDVITFGDVLEHLRSPGQVLERIRPFLAPDGCVVISVPNIAHAALVYELVHGRFEYRPTGLLDATHVRFFTRESLMHMLEEAGLVVTDLRRITREPQATEFGIGSQGPVDAGLLVKLLDAHPESRTYQFVLKAVPASNGFVSTLKVQKTIDHLDEMRRELDAVRAQVSKLNGEIEWLESRWPRNWVRRIRTALSGKGTVAPQ